MGFKRFVKTDTRRGKPQVSIWKRGQIAFNRGAVKKFDLDRFNFAILFYDKDHQKVGVKFTDVESEEGTIKIVIHKSGGISLSGSAFLSHHEIDSADTRKFDLTYDQDEDLYIFCLSGERG